MIHILSVLTYLKARLNPSQGSLPAVQPGHLFPTGALVMTHGVHELSEQGRINPATYFERHIRGDWGELCDEEKVSNQFALAAGERLFSSYDLNLDDQQLLWIITEADRSSTTLLLPSEY